MNLGGSGGGCCPETNEVLVTIKNDIEDVMETCVTTTQVPGQQTFRPTTAQDSTLFCTLIGCDCEESEQSDDLDLITGISVITGTSSILNILANASLSITLNNSSITATSTIVPGINGGGTGITVGLNCYIRSQTAGSCVINVLNLSLLSTININGKVIDFVIFN